MSPPYPPYPPYPAAPTSSPNPHPVRDLFIGVGLGLIPGILEIIAIGANGPSSSCNMRINPQTCFTPTPPVVSILSNASCELWVAALVVWIVLISFDRTRFIGLGMLIGWLIDMVAPLIGCLVIVPA